MAITTQVSQTSTHASNNRDLLAADSTIGVQLGNNSHVTLFAKDCTITMKPGQSAISVLTKAVIWGGGLGVAGIAATALTPEVAAGFVVIGGASYVAWKGAVAAKNCWVYYFGVQKTGV